MDIFYFTRDMTPEEVLSLAACAMGRATRSALFFGIVLHFRWAFKYTQV
jgi:hypothetical protein